MSGLVPLRLAVLVVIVSALQFTTPTVVTMHAAFAFCGVTNPANAAPTQAASNALRLRRHAGRVSGMNPPKCLAILTSTHPPMAVRAQLY